MPSILRCPSNPSALAPPPPPAPHPPPLPPPHPPPPSRPLRPPQAERHEAGWLAPGVNLCPQPLGGGGDEWAGRCHDVLRLSLGLLVSRLLDNWERVASADEGGAAAASSAAASAATSVGATRAKGHGGHAAGALAAGRRRRRSDRRLEAGAQRHHQQQHQHHQRQLAAAAVPQPRDADPLLYVYSGHDSSVSPLLASECAAAQRVAAWSWGRRCKSGTQARATHVCTAQACTGSG